jgi:hypothetical protein
MRAWLRIALFSIIPYLDVQAGENDPEQVRVAKEIESIPTSKIRLFLYSIDPCNAGVGILNNDEFFHGYFILGKVEIPTENEKIILLTSFAKGIREADGAAMCFNPRHGLRVIQNSNTNDFSICYECAQVQPYGFNSNRDFSTSGSPNKEFNEFLDKYGLERYKEQQLKEEARRRAEAEKAKQDLIRWKAAIPKSVQPLYESNVPNDSLPNILPLKEALSKEFPSQADRIQTLLAWYGSGAGPWSGHPMYESVAEALLLEYSLKDLIEATQAQSLSDVQFEGAARLFGGWGFSQKYPEGLKQVPESLKQQLWEHTKDTENDDKWARAKHAFNPQIPDRPKKERNLETNSPLPLGLLRAAKLDYPEAQRMLADLIKRRGYSFKEFGKTPPEAVRDLLALAGRTSGDACYELASAYEDGYFGKPDYVSARRYLEHGSSLGDRLCWKELAKLLSEGKGGAQDYSKAYYWISLEACCVHPGSVSGKETWTLRNQIVSNVSLKELESQWQQIDEYINKVRARKIEIDPSPFYTNPYDPQKEWGVNDEREKEHREQLRKKK